jgi:ABC-type glycerol-3-phosphate transport system permease component
MIPAIALMVGMYIVTRCAEIIVHERERVGTLDTGPAVLAILTIIITAGCLAWVFRLSFIAETALSDLLR